MTECHNLFSLELFLFVVLTIRRIKNRRSRQKNQGTLNRGSVGWQMSTCFSCFKLAIGIMKKNCFNRKTYSSRYSFEPTIPGMLSIPWQNWTYNKSFLRCENGLWLVLVFSCLEWNMWLVWNLWECISSVVHDWTSIIGSSKMVDLKENYNFDVNYGKQ